MGFQEDLKKKIDSQYREIERQKHELTESIRYASYIQNALLPGENLIKIAFPEHFLLHIAKDIVSGDFYWIYRRPNEVLVAVADCTGHGVPGAFMSILGISYLNEIAGKKYPSTGSILNTLREYVMKALNQTGVENEQKDGIDMALCKINIESNILEFSGAFNPLYVIKNKRLIEIAGDKMPIGVAADEENSFTTHSLELDEGDMIYLFSDGYVDQFGGKEEKKFKYQPFRSLLLDIHPYPVHKQKAILKKTFYDWKGELAQLDDVLMFGFRYHVNN